MEATFVETEAEALLLANTRDWSARAALALARLRQEHFVDALRAFDGVKITGTEPPGAIAIRAAVLWANGFYEGARNDASNLAAAALLPEERALIAPINAEDLGRGVVLD